MTLTGNKHGLLKRIRISEKTLRLIVRCFIFDITSSQASNLVQVNHNTADKYFGFLRSIVITEAIRERKREKIENGIEIDESYFGPRRPPRADLVISLDFVLMFTITLIM